MAEVIGIAASAVTLAALFSNCIECFSYFRAAQNCPTEAETLLVKLDCEKARLLIWANNVGILNAVDQGRRFEFANEATENLVRRCIEQLTGLLTDAHRLRTIYGSRQTTQHEDQHYMALVSVNSMNIFRTAKSRFFARFGATTKFPGAIIRVKWAIRDAVKFRVLLAELKDFVDNLITLVPVPGQQIDSIVQDDITTIIDIGGLKLTEKACQESYPSWSAKASEVIRDSEIGTTDRRNLEEMLDDTNIEYQLPMKVPVSRSREFKRGNVLLECLTTFAVFTHECLSTKVNSYCEADSIADSITDSNDICFTCPPSARWSLGKRLWTYVDESAYMEKLMPKLSSVSRNRDKQRDLRSMNRNYIYCGPCACAIQTALSVCAGGAASPYHKFSIRIDDRLPTSCCREDAVIEILEAIRDLLDEQAGLSNEQDQVTNSLEVIDSPHLETRIRYLEDYDVPPNPRTRLQEILDEQYSSLVELPNYGPASVIFIMEANTCQASFDEIPFQRDARRPRKGEIFLLKHDSDTETRERIEKAFVGSYTRSQKAIDKDKAERRIQAKLKPPPVGEDLDSESMDWRIQSVKDAI